MCYIEMENDTVNNQMFIVGQLFVKFVDFEELYNLLEQNHYR